MGRPPDSEVRVDKWLWAARWYKTRQLAAKAVDGGHVQINGNRVKPAKVVRIGDELQVKKGPYTYVLHIKGLSARRGPANAARLLYAETEASVTERERLAEVLKSRASQIVYDAKKPPSRERRAGRLRKREQN